CAWIASRICFATASMETGMRAASSLKHRLAVTTPRPDCQTIRSSGGILRNARKRSCQPRQNDCSCSSAIPGNKPAAAHATLQLAALHTFADQQQDAVQDGSVTFPPNRAYDTLQP